MAGVTTYLRLLVLRIRGDIPAVLDAAEDFTENLFDREAKGGDATTPPDTGT